MVKYTDSQKQVANQLVAGAKTIEDLSKLTKLTQAQLTIDLKELMKLNVITKLGGVPTKYELDKSVLEEIKRRKKLEEIDIHKFRIRSMIEVKAIEEDLLKLQLDKISKALQEDPDYTVYALHTAPMEKEGEYFSSFVETNMSVKNFKALVKFLFFLGPTTLEVIKPEKIDFSLEDFQTGMNDLVSMAHGYTNYITQILGKKELDEFTKKLYEK